MAGIASLDDFIGSFKQEVNFLRTSSATVTAGCWFDTTTQTGQPAVSAYYNPANTTTGVVPTQATGNGFATLNAYAAGALGYLEKVEYLLGAACRMYLADNLWIGGNYAYNASTTGQTPTSYLSRIPLDATGTPDYKNLDLFVLVTGFTSGVLSVAVTYNNETGTSHTTAATVCTPQLGAMTQIPLYAGDAGIQGVTGVVATSASSGTTFQVLVARRLWFGAGGYGFVKDVKTIWDTAHPQVFQDSALKLIADWDSTSSSTIDLRLLIASK